ncbi:M50 family metallopeptidase [Demequina sp. NBRC 110052]|uniref:M50 family metallopeptidase n=1 Tax=Demequina sp. NBRC 110052 TaxID=1570341 RepID=UPI000A01ACCB|nr:M50 family metallopeptidase [Demequina sp. NBRC 110052]
MNEIWDQVWADLTAVVEAPPSSVWIPLSAVAVCLAVPALWHVVRHVVTIAHEAGHGIVATLTGRRVSGIRLHSDTSGLTESYGEARRLPLSLVALAGYPAPALLGLGASALLADGRSPLVLWLVMLVLAVVLLFIRNVYGFLVVILAIGAFGWVAWAGGDVWRVGVAYGVVWLLLLGSVRAVVELSASRRGRGGRSGSDADALARLTHVPGGVWVAVFWLVAVACAALGGWWIVGLEI